MRKYNKYFNLGARKLNFLKYKKNFFKKKHRKLFKSGGFFTLRTQKVPC